MPAKGGAFFGFAIIVAAALITWGIIALVDVADDDSSSDDSSSRSITGGELQDALNNASPGSTIEIPVGTHEVSLTTTVSGTEDDPITITCESSDRDDCILTGDGDARVLEILHSWYIVEEFTIDGEISTSEYAEQLIFVQGTGEPEEIDDDVESALTGVTIRRMNLRNAGKECIRIRYFVTNSVVDENRIGPCGIEDFVLENNEYSNGEGVYIGTALTQINSKGDEFPRVDECSGIVVMNNLIETEGSEGVDIKEGSYGNIVYRNQISGQMDVDAGGISLRGDLNFVYYNRMSFGAGACIRIGGDSEDGVDYGQDNEVYVNEFNQCRYSAIKVNEGPQNICENTVITTTDPYDDGLYATVRGDAASDFPEDEITGSCSPEPTSIAEFIRVGTRFDFATIGSGDADVEEEEEEEEDGDRSIVYDSDEEEDDDTDASGAVFDDGDYSNEHVWRGCYKLNPNFPGLLFDALALDEDPSLTVAECVLACHNLDFEFAALQDGSTCWCGDQADFTIQGMGTCNSACTDAASEDEHCGGEDSFDLWQIYGDGGVDADDQGDDDGGIGTDESGTPSPVAASRAILTPSPLVAAAVVADQTEGTSAPMAAEEEDDDVVAIVPAGDYMGCYQDSDNMPILDFMYEDEETLTPASCIATCASRDDEVAGVQAGRQCWCGSADHYTRYGTSDTCNIGCTGDPNETCGGVNASSIWLVD